MANQNIITKCSLLHAGNREAEASCIEKTANEQRANFKEGGIAMAVEEDMSLMDEDTEVTPSDTIPLDDIPIPDESLMEEEEEDVEMSDEEEKQYLIDAFDNDPKLMDILEKYIGPEIDNIIEQDMKEGGPVEGPGGPTEDKVPALLSDGEYTINAESTEAIGEDTLNELNEVTTSDKPKFASGGLFKKALDNMKGAK
jgi:hypothetical protein